MPGARMSAAGSTAARSLCAVLLWVLLAGAALATPYNALRFTSADGLPSSAVRQLVEDRQGYLWFATEDGLARFDGHRFRVWRIEQGLADNQLLAIATDARDQLWMGTGHGQLMRMSTDREHIDVFDGARFPALAGTAISVVLPAPDGVIWFGTRDAGLFRLGPERRLRQYLPTRRGDGLPDRTVEHLAMTADGTLWVGTPNGLVRWNDGRFLAPEPALLGNAPVTALQVDAGGRLWVGGAAGPWRSVPGGRLEPVDASADTRPLAAARRGGPWLGDGAQVWQGDGGPLPGVTIAVTDNHAAPRFRSALEDRHGGVWLLGMQRGVWRLPPHWRHFMPAGTTVPTLPARDAMRLDAARPMQALQCADGSGWRISAQAIERHSPRGGSVRRWPRDAQVPLGREDGGVVHCDGVEGLWWGGRLGLARWTAGRFQRVSGVHGEVSALHVADDGALWIAGAGSVRRYQVTGTVARPGVFVDARQGLPPLQLTSLASDAHGAVWATSARGLLRLRPREGKVRLYTRSDGVPEAVFNAQLRADGAHMLALHPQGAVVRFDPAGLTACPGEPALVVERVQVHRDGHLQVLAPQPTLHLRPGDRDIQVSIRLLGAAVEAGQQYRFRLCGLDREWIRVGRSGTRGFPQLPPGEHRLEFQGRLGDGRWSATHVLQLHVERSGWHHPATLGLRVAAGALLLGGGTWATLRRLARTRRAQASEQRAALAVRSAHAKEQYLATLGHEVRTPLTGMLGMSELLLDSPLHVSQRQQMERIREGGLRVLQRVNQALDEARLEAGCAPVQSLVFNVAQVHRQWLARQVLPLCSRGTAVALCVHVAPGAYAHGDPDRLIQMMESVASPLVSRTGAGRLVLQVGWRPGREGLLLDFAASGTANRHLPPASGAGVATPAPTPAALSAALARARRMTHALGGRLRVHAGAGRQWRVLVSLPLPVAPPPPDLGGRDAAPPPGPGRRVLLVDDDAATAALGCRLLAELGHQAVHVPHALAALAELAAAQVDLVMLDLALPGLDGLALLELMRAQGFHAPVLAMTDRDTPGLAGRAIAAGATALLRKPTCSDTLRAALHEAGRG
jgi:CheY-like chemotaxis protein/signal transduction histidine kinase/streptogramin lyase